MTREEQRDMACTNWICSHENGTVIMARNVWKAAVEWADKHPAWIPVEEYPKVDISCTLLVHYVDGTIDICDYYGDYYDYTGENVTRNVTHWMPLPVPPQRKEAKNE